MHGGVALRRRSGYRCHACSEDISGAHLVEHALHVDELAVRAGGARRIGRVGGRQRGLEAVHQRQVLPAHAAGLRAARPRSRPGSRL